MIERIASNIVEQLLKEHLIDEEQSMYCEYAIVLLVEHFITVGTILMLSLIFDVFFPTVLFLAFFLTLRNHTGGFHCDTFIECYVLTVTGYILVVGMVPVLVRHSYVDFIIFVVAIIEIIGMGTINHPNMRLNSFELGKLRKRARVIIVLEVSAVCLSRLYNVDVIYIGYMEASIILCALLMCIAKIKKQEVNEDEDN